MLNRNDMLSHTEQPLATSLFLFRYSNTSELLCAFASISGSGMEEMFTRQVNICLDAPAARFGLFIAATGMDDLLRKIELVKSNISQQKPLRFAVGEKIVSCDISAQPKKVVFLFPGFGSEYPDMFEGLYPKFPFLENLVHLLGTLNDDIEATLSIDEIIEELNVRLADESQMLENGGVGVLASLAYYHILSALNVPCHAMVGHSNGENAAMFAAGVFQYSDEQEIAAIIKSVAEFSRKIVETGKGYYLAVNNFSADKVDALVSKYEGFAFIAMRNCPNQTVIYVLKEKYEEVKNAIFEQKGLALALKTDNPYHTPLFNEHVVALKRDVYSKISIGSSTVPLYSCTDSSLFEGDRDALVNKAIRQWTETVEFSATVQKLYSEGANIFIEVGPNNKLTNFVKDILRGKKCTALAANVKGEPNINMLIELAGQLWINNIDINFSVLDDSFTGTSKTHAIPEPPKPVGVPLPAAMANKDIAAAMFRKHQALMQQFLVMQEQSLNMFKQAVAQRAGNNSVARAQTDSPPVFNAVQWPLLAAATVKQPGKIYLERSYDSCKDRIFQDHALGKCLPVIAFTLSMEIISEAAALLYDGRLVVSSIQNTAGHSWLVFSDDTLDIAISAEETESTGAGTHVRKSIQVIIYEMEKATRNKKKAFEGTVILSSAYAQPPKITLPEKVPMKASSIFYDEYLFHGPYFKGIDTLAHLGNGAVAAGMKMPMLTGAFEHTNNPVFRVPGEFLDCAGQLAAYWLAENGVRDFTVFPFHMKAYEQYAAFPKQGEYLLCSARFEKNEAILNAEIYFSDNLGNVIARFTGFRFRMYMHPMIPRIILDRLDEEQMLSINADLLQEAGGIYGQVLAKLIFKGAEYEEWLQVEQSAQDEVQYLVEKIQHKYTHTIINA